MLDTTKARLIHVDNATGWGHALILSQMGACKNDESLQVVAANPSASSYAQSAMDWKHIATLSEKEQLRAWVENWKRVGPELEHLKREELRAMSEEKGLQRLRRVMDSRAPERWRDPARRMSSGLIEQQRLFSRLAKESR